jgi:hypothetical protein
MNDNGDEDQDEELRAIVSGTNELIRILEKSHDPHMAMQILASTTACILCSVMDSEEQAHAEFKLFIDAITRSIHRAKKNHLVVWPEGSSH